MAWYKLDEEGNIEGLLKPLAPLINYVARLNGTDQYWQLSEAIPLVGNFRVDIEMSADAGNQLPMKVTDGQGLVESRRVDTNLVNYFFDPRDYMHIEVNGVETLEAPSNGESFMLSLIRSEQEVNRADKEVYILGARFTQSNHLKGYIKSIKVYDESDVLVNEIPLTNKAQGATQLATVGNVNATLVNYTEAVWEELPPPPQVNYGAIGVRFSQAQNSQTPYTYIVAGDSTRDSISTPSIEYYAQQLAKVNFNVVDNSESGQSASDWLNNTSTDNLNAAIAATPGTGATTILEMSLGINREQGQTQQDIKQDIIDGLEVYLSAKPDTLIVFVSPNRFNTVQDYEVIYQELADYFLNSVFVSGYTATNDVYGDPDFYADDTHPSVSGLKRVNNYIFSNILPDDVVNNMTLEDEEPVDIDPVIPATVETGFYFTANGGTSSNTDWRRLSEVAVEPNFTIRIDHGGNRFECMFMAEDKSYISKQSSSEAQGESYRTVQVPPNAYYMRCNVSDDGATYDTLSYPVSLIYVINETEYLSQEQINAGLDIRMPVVNS